MHQNRFRLGLCPRHRWGSLHAPPNPLAVFKGPTSKRKKGERVKRREEEGKGKGRGRGRGRKGKGGGERPYTPPVANSWLRHCIKLLYNIIILEILLYYYN